jgi:hypothetical protein
MRGFRNRNRRGAVLILCTILMASVATILLSTADLGMAAVRMQQAAEDSARLQYTTDSVKAISTQMMIDRTLILPSTTKLTINGASVSFDATALTGERNRMVSLMTTYSDRRQTRTEELTIGARGLVSPFWFAFGTFAGSALASNLSCNADVYLNDEFSGAGSLTTTGRVYASGSNLVLLPTAAQGIVYNKPIPAPPFSAASYSSAADTTISGTTLPSAAPLSFKDLGTYQSLWYRAGSLILNNTYEGSGTIFVDGNVTIRGLTAVNPSDKLVVIATGNVVLMSSRIDAFILCKGIVDNPGAGDVQISGAVHCSGVQSNKNVNFKILFDPFFWTDPQWDKRMRVPGMW